ncbi:alpha-ketoacid dehydrogenase kinase [Metschnikowia bicuspidata var. bicuspidata NRRL YB-4993]|uniref:Protein-serine/threonine kinase n=1 Tax=Metschnikowia bicuspidata var. bicuspidata NRRL YB-4993 TaxID=869754 RepID=A0A1A0H5T4_9ASCO|nr:alpha-ketoacid dehydrogenase kinase [Metschnikowia bicuspidata var. bicuspidata NRRL YB-4993]OBA19267.1 alpha-ketoacid dehydrogenase kinase [Metschnikowia bicuspidata var. bicuspidata NRRL YB-4993]
MEYKVRSSLERLIYHYSNQPLSKFSMLKLYEQSRNLNETNILQVARDVVESLLAYNAMRLRNFRDLPYLVMLNPSISELYNMYLKSMSILLKASLNPPNTLEENEAFSNGVLSDFIEIHADALPTLSKGFSEVTHLLTAKKIKSFLDKHLVERISMRLIAHQHIQLTKSLLSNTFENGGSYNGVIKMLDIREVIRKNVELVNDIFLMKYDLSVAVKIDTNLHPGRFWTLKEPPTLEPREDNDASIHFPYIEYHLEYILQEIFKNSFRAHIENNVSDPVQITVSTSESPSYMELRIRDKGKGIPPQTLQHMFDYLFTTYESNEGEAFKTLNVPPGMGGNTVAGMGYGLPLLKSYIEIFNDTVSLDTATPAVKGLLSVQTYWGWGTDVYLKTVGQ